MAPESKFTIKAIRSYVIGGVGSGTTHLLFVRSTRDS